MEEIKTHEKQQAKKSGWMSKEMFISAMDSIFNGNESQ